MALFLRDEEVRQVVTMGDMLEAIESMQRHFGRGEAYNLPRRKIIAASGLFIFKRQLSHKPVEPVVIE